MQTPERQIDVPERQLAPELWPNRHHPFDRPVQSSSPWIMSPNTHVMSPILPPHRSYYRRARSPYILTPP